MLLFLLMQQTELPTGNNHIISKCNVWLKKCYIVRSSTPNSFIGLFWRIASCLRDANFVRHLVEGKLPGKGIHMDGWIKHVGKASHISPLAVPLEFVSQHVGKWKLAYFFWVIKTFIVCNLHVKRLGLVCQKSKKNSLGLRNNPIISNANSNTPCPTELHVLSLKWCRRDHRLFHAWQSGVFSGIYNVFQIEGTELYCTSSAVI